jgi:large conductance mechanosensitive channel
MLQEFQKFIMRGNVIDLAVAVIMGAAFGPIVTSLVDNIIMPPIGWLIGGVDFSSLAIALPPSPTAAADAPLVVIGYGIFLQAIFKFLIVAFAVFMLVRTINSVQERFKKKEAEAPAAPTPPTDEAKLLMEIRDLLKAGR